MSPATTAGIGFLPDFPAAFATCTINNKPVMIGNYSNERNFCGPKGYASPRTGRAAFRASIAFVWMRCILACGIRCMAGAHCSAFPVSDAVDVWAEISVIVALVVIQTVVQK